MLVFPHSRSVSEAVNKREFLFEQKMDGSDWNMAGLISRMMESCLCDGLDSLSPLTLVSKINLYFTRNRQKKKIMHH